VLCCAGRPAATRRPRRGVDPGGDGGEERAEAVDEKFRQLEIDITIAEDRLASETADDATSFAKAVEAELHDWDAAMERLQTRAASKAQNARKQAEAEIAELRQPRNRAAERLTALAAVRIARTPEEFPAGPTGKVLKRELRTRHAALLSAR